MSLVRQLRQAEYPNEAVPRDSTATTAEKPEKLPGGLPLGRFFAGQVVRISETDKKETFLGELRTLHDNTSRHYDVVVLKEVGEPREAMCTFGSPPPVKIRRIIRSDDNQAEMVGPPMSTAQLEGSLIGNVTRISEKRTTTLYQGGLLVTREETERVFDVNFKAGF